MLYSQSAAILAIFDPSHHLQIVAAAEVLEDDLLPGQTLSQPTLLLPFASGYMTLNQRPSELRELQLSHRQT